MEILQNLLKFKNNLLEFLNLKGNFNHPILKFISQKYLSIIFCLISFNTMIISFKHVIANMANKKARKSLKNKTAIVTGGTDGIGKQLAKQLQLNDIKVIITGRNQQKINNTIEELNKDIGQKTAIQGVLLDMNENFTYEKLEETFKNVDFDNFGALFNNAGTNSEHRMFLIEETRIDEIITVNNLNLVKLTQFVAEKTVKTKHKKYIVNTGSFTGSIPCPLVSVYAASKAFLRSFSESLYFEMRAMNFHVEYIDTGFVSTKMSKIKPSLFAPGPESFAVSVVESFGYFTVNKAYFLHALVFKLVCLFPRSLVGKAVFLEGKIIRQKALKKRKND